MILAAQSMDRLVETTSGRFNRRLCKPGIKGDGEIYCIFLVGCGCPSTAGARNPATCEVIRARFWD